MIKGYFIGSKVVSTSPSSFSLYEKSRFGEKKGKKIEYSAFETLFLVEQGKMEVFFGKKLIEFEDLLKKFRRQDKRVDTKYSIFVDLRKKGYVVKSALKFGGEFRVYDRGRMEKDHARWILNSVREGEKIDWHDFAAKNRVAHSTRKNLLFGIVDEEGDVTYYEIGWVKA
jgi:tRNA-intron endonuclease, archaea type